MPAPPAANIWGATQYALPLYALRRRSYRIRMRQTSAAAVPRFCAVRSGWRVHRSHVVHGARPSSGVKHEIPAVGAVAELALQDDVVRFALPPVAFIHKALVGAIQVSQLMKTAAAGNVPAVPFEMPYLLIPDGVRKFLPHGVRNFVLMHSFRRIVMQHRPPARWLRNCLIHLAFYSFANRQVCYDEETIHRWIQQLLS